jgi:hypothetical protein
VTASRTLWVLHLDGPDDARFPAALELLHEGRAIGYRGISISLDTTTVRCCAPASWRPEALTDERALADFDAMQKAIDELRTARFGFDAALRTRHLRFSLVEDYGTGVVELCRLEAGKVVGLAQS